MEAGSSRVLLPCSQGREESMEVFREGIELAMNFCRAFQFYVTLGYFGSQPSLRIQNFFDSIFSLFIQSKEPPTKIELMRQLNPLHTLPCSLDDDIEEVSDQLLAMYQECLCGDFSSIQIIKEANARRLMWKRVNKFELESPFSEKIKKANLTRFDTMWRKKDRRHAREVAALKNEEKA
ncbi:pre-rRNA-processing TSR2-like protein, partial [Trifolium medium]|nr:pre-rRNA-processing TSR2-like protein [Trifolium medium]